MSKHGWIISGSGVNELSGMFALAELISERLDRLDSLAAMGKRIKDTPMLRAFSDAIGRDAPRTCERLPEPEATATA